MDNEIRAVNLNCINSDDPTNGKCNGGWFFRDPTEDVKAFLKYPSLKFSCLGNQYIVVIWNILFCNSFSDSFCQHYCFASVHDYHKDVNSPCEVENKDIWTFERTLTPGMHVNDFEGIKKLTEYKTESGCCRKLSSSLKRNKLQLIMEMMKHSLGTPIPDNRLNKSFEEYSLLWPTENIKQKIEKK